MKEIETRPLPGVGLMTETQTKAIKRSLTPEQMELRRESEMAQPDFEQIARKILAPFDDPTDPLWRSSLQLAIEQLRQVWNAADTAQRSAGTDRLVDDLSGAMEFVRELASSTCEWGCSSHPEEQPCIRCRAATWLHT